MNDSTRWRLPPVYEENTTRGDVGSFFAETDVEIHDLTTPRMKGVAETLAPLAGAGENQTTAPGRLQLPVRGKESVPVIKVQSLPAETKASSLMKRRSSDSSPASQQEGVGKEASGMRHESLSGEVSSIMQDVTNLEKALRQLKVRLNLLMGRV